MKNINKLCLLAGILAVELLSNTKPANAIIFSFYDDNDYYNGTLEFSGTGTNLAPLLTPNTRLTKYQGSQVDSVASTYGNNYNPDAAPLFDVTSSSLTVTSEGGLTYAEGQSLTFLPPSELIDYSIFYISSFNSAPATEVPFEFNPGQGVALGLPLFIGLRMLKKRRALKKSNSELKEIIN